MQSSDGELQRTIETIAKQFVQGVGIQKLAQREFNAAQLRLGRTRGQGSSALSLDNREERVKRLVLGGRMLQGQMQASSVQEWNKLGTNGQSDGSTTNDTLLPIWELAGEAEPRFVTTTLEKMGRSAHRAFDEGPLTGRPARRSMTVATIPGGTVLNGWTNASGEKIGGLDLRDQIAAFDRGRIPSLAGRERVSISPPIGDREEITGKRTWDVGSAELRRQQAAWLDESEQASKLRQNGRLQAKQPSATADAYPQQHLRRLAQFEQASAAPRHDELARSRASWQPAMWHNMKILQPNSEANEFDRVFGRSVPANEQFQMTSIKAEPWSESKRLSLPEREGEGGSIIEEISRKGLEIGHADEMASQIVDSVQGVIDEMFARLVDSIGKRFEENSAQAIQQQRFFEAGFAHAAGEG